MKEKSKYSFNRQVFIPFLITLGWTICVPVWIYFLFSARLGPIYGPSLTMTTIQNLVSWVALIAGLLAAVVGFALRFAFSRFNLLWVLGLTLSWSIIASALIALSMFVVMTIDFTLRDWGAAQVLYGLILMPLNTALAGGSSAWITAKLLRIAGYTLTDSDIKALMRRWIVGFFAFGITLIITFALITLFWGSRGGGPIGFADLAFLLGTPSLVSGFVCGRALKLMLQGSAQPEALYDKQKSGQLSPPNSL